jgi:hypothetical protein
LIILLLTWAILQSTSWFEWLNGVKIKLLFQRPRGAVVWIIFASNFPPDFFFKTFYSTLDTTSCDSRVFVAINVNDFTGILTRHGFDAFNFITVMGNIIAVLFKINSSSTTFRWEMKIELIYNLTSCII